MTLDIEIFKLNNFDIFWTKYFIFMKWNNNKKCLNKFAKRTSRYLM